MATTLITGASSGIGLELAKCFAADGDSLILVSRSAEKLNAIAQALSDEHKIVATGIAVDLAKPDAVDRLVDELEAKDIVVDTLVNSAG